MALRQRSLQHRRHPSSRRLLERIGQRDEHGLAAAQTGEAHTERCGAGFEVRGEPRRGDVGDEAERYDHRWIAGARGNRGAGGARKQQGVERPLAHHLGNAACPRKLEILLAIRFVACFVGDQILLV